MTAQQNTDLDLVMDFLFREQQDQNSYWNLLVGFLVSRHRLPDTNVLPEVREYWEMVVYQTILDGYILIDGPVHTFKKTLKGRNFFNGVPNDWQGRPYAYAAYRAQFE